MAFRGRCSLGRMLVTNSMMIPPPLPLPPLPRVRWPVFVHMATFFFFFFHNKIDWARRCVFISRRTRRHFIHSISAAVSGMRSLGAAGRAAAPVLAGNMVTALGLGVISISGCRSHVNCASFKSTDRGQGEWRIFRLKDEDFISVKCHSLSARLVAKSFGLSHPKWAEMKY